MLSHDARPAPVPPPGRQVGGARGQLRQLVLPLGPLDAAPPPPGAARVRPRQVWARRAPPVQAEVRGVVWRVLEEVLRDERHD